MPAAASPRVQGLRLASSAAGWVLFLAVLGSVMALGAVHTMVLVGVTLVLAVACVFAWWGAEPARMRSAATVLLSTGLALTAYTLVQALPMPAGWLARLSP